MEKIEKTIKELKNGSSLRITIEQRDRIIKYLEELKKIKEKKNG